MLIFKIGKCKNKRDKKTISKKGRNLFSQSKVNINIKKAKFKPYLAGRSFNLTFLLKIFPIKNLFAIKKCLLLSIIVVVKNFFDIKI